MINKKKYFIITAVIICIIIVVIIFINLNNLYTFSNVTDIINDMNSRLSSNIDIIETQEYNNEIFIFFTNKDDKYNYGLGIYEKNIFNRFSFARMTYNTNYFYIIDGFLKEENKKLVNNLAIACINFNNNISYVTIRANNEYIRLNFEKESLLFIKRIVFENSNIEPYEINFFDKYDNNITDYLHYEFLSKFKSNKKRSE